MSFKIYHSKDDDGDEENLSDINIVPLVDVMLVLLVIFMVTAPLSIGGINVSLPSSKAKSITVDEDRIVLSINSQGQFFIEKTEVLPAMLEPKIKAIFEHRTKKNIYIRADEKVHYGKVVEAMSAAKVAGVSKMSMLTGGPKGKVTK